MCYSNLMRVQKYTQVQSQPSIRPQFLRGSVTIAGKEVAVSAEAVNRSSPGTASADAVIKLRQAAKRGVFPPAVPTEEKHGE